MQSIDSLRELNAKFLAEIAELRKKFSEIKIENENMYERVKGFVRTSTKIISNYKRTYYKN